MVRMKNNFLSKKIRFAKEIEAILKAEKELKEGKTIPHKQILKELWLQK